MWKLQIFIITIPTVHFEYVRREECEKVIKIRSIIILFQNWRKNLSMQINGDLMNGMWNIIKEKGETKKARERETERKKNEAITNNV